MTPELAGSSVAFLLTVVVFSYLLGDNPLYRLVLHVFVGVSAGYAATVAIQSVLLPRVGHLAATLPGLLGGDPVPFAFDLVPVVLGVLILLKVSPTTAPYGNAAMGFIVGVGAAAAVGGAVSGTLFPQVRASWGGSIANAGGLQVMEALGNTAIMLLAAVLVLMYFFYSGQPATAGSGQRPPWLEPVAAAGQFFITVALAALYAGALAASLALFVERAAFLFQYLTVTAPQILAVLGF